MNKYFKILLLICIVSFSDSKLIAQKNTDGRLAAQYYNNKEYDKAVIYYHVLADSKQHRLNIRRQFAQLAQQGEGDL